MSAVTYCSLSLHPDLLHFENLNTLLSLLMGYNKAAMVHALKKSSCVEMPGVVLQSSSCPDETECLVL